MVSLATCLLLSRLIVAVYSGLDLDYSEVEIDDYEFQVMNTRIQDVILSPLEKINVAVIPTNNISESLEINMDFSLLSVTNFNELSGELNLVAFLKLSWNAINLPRWKESLLSGRTSLTVNSDMIWTPSLFVINPTHSVKDLTSTSHNLRISNNGTVSWDILAGIEAACSVDVTNFPFDSQTCSVLIAPWGYDSSEVHFNGRIDRSLDFLFTQNSAWRLRRTDIETVTMGYDIPYIKVSLEITRLHEYFLINVLIPPILLSVLSPCVFLLPASSGERMSYAITCFLAFSVFMSMLSDNMPKSSVPIAHLSYFMMYMLIHSCSVTVTTVFTLRIYNKAESGKLVPRWLQVTINCLLLQFCLNRTKRPDENGFQPHNIEIAETPVEIFTEADAMSRHGSIDLHRMNIGKKYAETGSFWKDEVVTWFLVGKVIDSVLFLGYLAWMLFIVISFLVALGMI